MADNSSWPLFVQVLSKVKSREYVVQSYARIGRVGALLLLRPPLTFRVDGSADAAELGAQIERALMAGAEQTGRVDKTQGFGSADYMKFLHVRSWRQLHREWRTLTVEDDGQQATVLARGGPRRPHSARRGSGRCARPGPRRVKAAQGRGSRCRSHAGRGGVHQLRRRLCRGVGGAL